MSFFEAPAAIFWLLSLLTLPLFSNEFGTDALNSTLPVSLSASKIPVSNMSASSRTTGFNATVTDPTLASELALMSQELSIAAACPSVVAALGTPVGSVECDTFPVPHCNTWTTVNFPESIYPPPSCCDTCTILASRVQVNYWAPETNSNRTTAATQTPETPYTLVSDGYTFTSPSVYVVYKDLSARADCTYYAGGQLGDSISNVTIAYDPGALSTAECRGLENGGYLGYQPIDYSNWYNPVPNSVMETQPGCLLHDTKSIDPAGTDLLADPYFSIPQGLSSLKPLWSSYSCMPWGRSPAFDPPRVLTKTSALAPAIEHPAGQSATAIPAAQLPTPIITPTAPNSVSPAIGAATPDPKSVSADPNTQGIGAEPVKSNEHPTPTYQDVDTPNSDPDTVEDEAPHTSPGKANSVLTVGSEVYQYHIDAASNLVIASQTAFAGGPTIYISRVPIALLSSANSVIIDGTSIPVAKPESTPKPGFPMDKETITTNNAGQYVVSGQTITPGAPAITISGTRISLDPSAINLVVGTSTIPFQEQVSLALPSFTIGNEVITGDSASRYLVDGQTLAPGAPAITVSGTPISLAASGAYVAVGGTTILLQDEKAPFPPVFILNGKVITANSASQLIVGGQTLTPGASAVTIQGTLVSVPANVPPFITVGSQAYPYTVNSAGDIIIASQTVVPGGTPVTVSGQAISEASDRSDLVFASGNVVTTENLAQLIVGALGKSAESTGNARGNTSFDGQMFTGGARKGVELKLFGLAATIALLAAIMRGAN